MFSSRVEDILDQLIELPTAERGVRLEELCAEDARLRDEVASLLQAFERSGPFLQPVGRRILRPSDRIGRYRIVAELGRGAMGIVYLAEDPHLGRKVAIKTLSAIAAGSSARRERLRDEARMLAAVSQPNIAQVYSFEELPIERARIEPTPNGFESRDPAAVSIEAESGDRQVDSILTMEYVPGVTLAQKLKDGPLSSETCLEIVRQIAAALEAAHAEGVVHRDLKPQNVRVTPGGWVKVLDFGLAFLLDRETSGSMRPCGTVGYMSPEQAAGREIGRGSDLWSLGRILIECLSGRLPDVESVDTPGSSRAATGDGPARSNEVPDTVAPTVRQLLLDLLDVDPARRPTATQTRRILEEELLRVRAYGLLRDSAGGSLESAGRIPIASGPGNLPRPLSEFIGRERALLEVETLLREHRLVTLTGPGGAGKTRLAVEQAHRSRGRYRDGAWFIDLSTIESGEEIAGTLAHTLGARDAPGEKGAEALEAVMRVIAGQEVLLVVDNCEHVLESTSACLTAVLERCPSVRVLATSRTALGCDDEQLYVTPPLGVPNEGDDPSTYRMSEAVRLFEARARSRQSSFRIHDSHLEIIAAICRRADGLPLAIEIAAGHTRALAISEILARFEADPLSLGTPMRVVPARHRSLAGTVSWGYRLLGRSERLLFERLSVFRGGWTLEAAEAVCVGVGISGWQICDLIARLVERSLVEVEALDHGSHARYRLLETIQRFAQERLGRRAQEPETTEERYVEYFSRFAVPHPDEPEVNLQWVARIDGERSNLNQALSIALRRRWTRRAFALAAALTRYWTTAGLWREGLAILNRVMELRSSASVDAFDPRDEVIVLGSMARLSAVLNHLQPAFDAANRAVILARSIGDTATLARALRDAGAVHWYAVDIDRSEAFFQEALDLTESLEDPAALATCYGNLAAIHGVRSEYEQALALYQRQLKLCRRVEDQLGIAKALFSQGRMLDRLGRPEEAIEPLLESLQVHRDSRDLPGIALCLHNLGEACTSLHRREEALQHLTEALRIRLLLGNNYGICSVLLGLGRASGDPEFFAEILGGVLRAFDQLEIPILESQHIQLKETISGIERDIGKQRASNATGRGESRSLTELAAWALERRETKASETAHVHPDH